MYLHENNVSFGFSSISIRDNFVVFKENGIDNFIFVSGQRLVALEPKSNTTQFFTPPEPLQVTNLVISQDEKFVALSSEVHQNKTVKVIIYNIASLKRVSTLTHKENVTAICFSSDSLHLISTTSSSISIWDWDKRKIAFTDLFQSSCTRLSCPRDYAMSSGVVVCASGPRYCRLWAAFPPKLSELKILSTEQNESNINFIDHAWLPNFDSNKAILAILIGPLEDNSTNPLPHGVQIYSFQRGTATAARIRIELNQEIKLHFQCYSIISLRMPGFAISGSDGTVQIYENRTKTYERLVYVKTKGNTEPNEGIFHTIKQSSASPDLLVADITNRNISKVIVDEKETKSIILYRLTNDVGHMGGVRDMGTCIDRPLIVSCGRNDDIVSVWNYHVRHRIAKLECPESKPHSVAIHPSGYQMAVGFQDKLTMFHVLIDSIKPYRSVQCHAPVHLLEFNPRFLAAVVGNTINLYEVYQKKNFMSFILVLSFTGHIGPLNSIQWTDDTLFSAGTDRNLYGWNLSSASRIDAMNVVRSFGSCVSIAFSSSQRKYDAACVTSDGSLHKLTWNGIISDACTIVTKQNDSHDPPTIVTFNMDQSALLVGMRSGAIRCYKWHSSPDNFDFICTSQVLLHQSPTSDPISKSSINRLRMTPNHLIWSAGEIDGSIFSCVVSPSESSLSTQSVVLGVDETILTTKEEYESKLMLIDTLKSNLEQLKNDHEYNLHSNDNLWRSEVEDLSCRSEQLLNAERQRYDELQTKHDEAMKHHIRELEDRDMILQSTKKEIEATYTANELKQRSTIAQLKADLKAAHENNDTVLKNMAQTFDENHRQLNLQHEKEVKELQSRIYKLEEDVASSSKIFQELLEQQEEEYELMITNLKAKADANSHKEERVKDEIIASMHSLKFERDQLLRQVEELKSKSLFSDESFKREFALRRSLQEEKEELRSTLSEMSSRIEKETHQKDCLGKDLQMAEKIQGELKEKLQSTENSKFPLLTEIENLKSQVSTLKHDDQLHKKVIDEKDVAIQRLESKLSSSNKEKKQLSSQIRVLKRELVLLSGMNESELKTAIDCICAKYSV